MLKTIRLTGRRQLPVGAFDFQIFDQENTQIAALAIVDPSCLKGFPADAEIKVRISENKTVEILHFGTMAAPLSTTSVMTKFLAPSCQIRAVVSNGDHEGKLLGSTKPWTYKSDGQIDGILLFQESSHIAPKLWKLDLRDEEYPILYVNDTIPDPGLWAKTDPVFHSCVLPVVIGSIFDRILETGESPEDGWMLDWLNWAASFVSIETIPFSDHSKREDWIENLIDAFLRKHDFVKAAAHQLSLGVNK